MVITGIIIAAFFMVAIVLPAAIRIIKEYERGVVLRWGRFHSVKQPGIRFLIPFIDQMFRVDLRVVT
ncbi:MAG: slipin family protein, partial [Armatimonadetes bacterium]|nr:slipin family protein [Armatimonadota bacterium]